MLDGAILAFCERMRLNRRSGGGPGTVADGHGSGRARQWMQVGGGGGAAELFVAGVVEIEMSGGAIAAVKPAGAR